MVRLIVVTRMVDRPRAPAGTAPPSSAVRKLTCGYMPPPFRCVLADLRAHGLPLIPLWLLFGPSLVPLSPVNSHGRICHGILGRDWDSRISVKEVLDCIYGLLLVPDIDDALDSHLA